ncbi:MAG: type II secretion system protein [Nitrosomonadales bacterium]|nr:type II secretion system protein [Nitrosomonadales bacterium]
MRIAWNKSGSRKQACRVGGFTYIGLLLIVTIMGVGLVTTSEVWHTAQKREKERELLFIGNQFRQALNGYYEHTPGRERRYPLRLEDLLKDPRYQSTQRYLRKIFADPVGGGEKWGLVRGPDGEIYGVHSLSEDEPMKKSNFSLADRNFEGKTKYADWVFMHVPGQRPASPSPGN